MQQTGKRHPFYNQYTVGFDDNGVIQGADITVAGNCGYSPNIKFYTSTGLCSTQTAAYLEAMQQR